MTYNPASGVFIPRRTLLVDDCATNTRPTGVATNGTYTYDATNKCLSTSAGALFNYYSPPIQLKHTLTAEWVVRIEEFNYLYLPIWKSPRHPLAPGTGNFTGNATFTQNSGSVSGSGTAFDTQFHVNDYISTPAGNFKITNIASATSMTITPVYSGATVTTNNVRGTGPQIQLQPAPYDAIVTYMLDGNYDNYQWSGTNNLPGPFQIAPLSGSNSYEDDVLVLRISVNINSQVTVGIDKTNGTWSPGGPIYYAPLYTYFKKTYTDLNTYSTGDSVYAFFGCYGQAKIYRFALYEGTSDSQVV